MMKHQCVFVILCIVMIFTACSQNKGVIQDTASTTISETEEVIEIIEEIDIYSDYTLTDEFEFDDYNIEIYRCNNEADNYQIDWRNKETYEITSVITGSSLLMVTSAGYVFEEIYDGENYKVHGYNQGELLLDIIVDEVDLNDERPMAINLQYRKGEEEIPEEDFKLEMSDVIKKYKFSDYDGIVFGRYVRDFPMDEDVFISLVEEEMEEIIGYGGEHLSIDNILIDIDFDGTPELIQNVVKMFFWFRYYQSYYNLSKGEKIMYDVYIDGINSYDTFSSILGSIFLKETADGNKTFYVDLHYSIGPTVDYRYYYFYDGIYMMDIEEFNIIYSPIAQTTESNDNIVYKILDEKTGILIETNEAKYNKFVEEFKNTGCIDYLMTNKELFANYHFTDESLDTYDPVLLNQMKESLIEEAKKYIFFYKKSDMINPLEICFDKQNFVGNMEKATEYVIENIDETPSLLYLTDINTDGMPELIITYPDSEYGRYEILDISGDKVEFLTSGKGMPKFKNYVDTIMEEPQCVATNMYIEPYIYSGSEVDCVDEITYKVDADGTVDKTISCISREISEEDKRKKYSYYKDFWLNFFSSQDDFNTYMEDYYSTLHEISLPYAEAKYEEVKYSEDEFRKVFAELTTAYIESCETIAETQDEWLVFDIVND